MERRKAQPTVSTDPEFNKHMAELAHSQRLDYLAARLLDQMDALKARLEDIEDIVDEAAGVAEVANFAFSCAKVHRAQGALGAILAAVENFSQHTDW